MDNSNAKDADLSALKIDRSKKSRVPGRWKKWRHLLWLAVPIIVYFGYQFALEEVSPTVKVRTDTVRYITGSIAGADLVATGYVVAQIQAAVSSKATGRLKILNVEEGDTVKAGEILAELENDDFLAELDLAYAYLKQARADSVAALLNYNRQKTLLEKGHGTEEIFETATAAYLSALANVEARVAGVKAVQVALENTIIRAPFDGTVLTKNADVGEMVAPMASSASSRGAVVSLADMSSLEVEADVSESNIYKVKVRQPCEIILDAYPQHKYRGYVKKIVPTADRAKATVMIKIAFHNKDERVLPEMSARVNFLPVESEVTADKIDSALVVNNDAITMRDGQKAVFKVIDNTAGISIITAGRRLGSVTEIISGLKPGDKVILSPPGGLSAGDKVETIN